MFQSPSVSNRLCVLALLIACARDCRAATEDGFYATADTGPVVSTITGKEIHLGEKLDEKGVRVAWLRSISNQNDRFEMSLEKDGAFLKGSDQTVFCVNDYCTTFQGSGSVSNKVFSMDTWFASAEAAEAYAKFFKTTVRRRAHPGYLISTRLVPTKGVFTSSEPIPVTLEIRNIGNVEVSFRVGGENRGARDNQFGFTAYGISAVQDTGDPIHFGGLSYNAELKPGETFRKEVDLRKWFTFKPGTYQVVGTYGLDFFPPGSSEYFVTWHDYAAARFELIIQ